MQRQDDEIDRRSGMTGRRQRRIERPAGSGAAGARFALDEGRDRQQRERHRQQPERDVVHARERHVRRADHQRNHPVAETADHRRHHHEEDHDQAVRGHKYVVLVSLVENLHAGKHQFRPDRHRHQGADEPRDEGEHQVHRADVLVIGRIDEPPPAGRKVVRVIVMAVIGMRCCGRCHFQILFKSCLAVLFVDPSGPVALSRRYVPSICARALWSSSLAAYCAAVSAKA